MATLKTLFRGRIVRRFSPAVILIRNTSSFAKMMEYKRCCKILGVREDSDQEEIRQAYLKLVKRYHPDSGTPEADADKFSEIDRAFKLLIHKKSTERWNVISEDVQEQDIKHTAPQHRQYLNYDGIGSGTPFQRQKQYAKVRAVHAAENVLRHRVNKISAEEGALLDKAPLKHKIKTKYGLDRLVEDLIQESMSRGEFSNLSGSGKPLPNHQTTNPYVDFVTHKLNEVLIDNGFTPEWITLQKEIREEIGELRKGLSRERSFLGPSPLTSEERSEWEEVVRKYQKLTDEINKKIGKFNLVVPIMQKQMIPVCLEKESEKIVVNGEHSRDRKGSDRKNDENVEQTSLVSDAANLFGFIELLFKK